VKEKYREVVEDKVLFCFCVAPCYRK
jgi:hypothetical protein